MVLTATRTSVEKLVLLKQIQNKYIITDNWWFTIQLIYPFIIEKMFGNVP